MGSITSVGVALIVVVDAKVKDVEDSGAWRPAVAEETVLVSVVVAVEADVEVLESELE